MSNTVPNKLKGKCVKNTDAGIDKNLRKKAVLKYKQFFKRIRGE